MAYPSDGSPNLRPGAERFPTSAAPLYDPELLLDELFEDFVAASASIINDETEQTYREAWRYFRTWLDQSGVRPVLGSLSKALCVAYIAAQQRRPKQKGAGTLSSASVHTYTRPIRTFVRTLVADGYYPTDLFAGGQRGIMPKQGPRILKTATPGDLERLLGGTEARSRRPLNRLELACRERDELIILLAADAGPRARDIGRLTIADVDLANGWGHVRHGKGDRERAFPMSRETIACARLYLRRVRPVLSATPTDGARPDEPLLLTARGEAMRSNTIYQMLSRTDGRAGGTGRFGPHRFRHLFGTAAAEGGMHPLISQRIMGHADEKSQRVYQHPADAVVKAEHAKVTPLRTLAAARRRRLG